MKIRPISSPLPGEHVSTTSPIIRPEADDAAWRLRLNFWAGRSLTAEALELEQDNRAAHLAWRGRLASAGIVRGLEIALEFPETVSEESPKAGHFIHLLPGHAFLADGEDTVVPRPLRIPLDQIPVEYVRIGSLDLEQPLEPPPAEAVPGEPRQAGGFVYHVDRFPAGRVPWAAVLVLVPAEFRAFRGVDPEDPCELDPSLDAFADERRIDASMFSLCELPVALQNLPLLADPDDPRWRNRLVHSIFATEAALAARHQLRVLSGQPETGRWDTVLRSEGLLPWQVLGAPLALLGSEPVTDLATRRFFLDRAGVARPGGLARQRTRPAFRIASDADGETLNPPGAGTAFNWRARIDQFAEHFSSFEIRDETDFPSVEEHFQFVPPAGFLPRTALHFLTTAQALSLVSQPDQQADRAGVSHFFPAGYAVEAVPVPIEDLDAALASSASLAPYDLADPAVEPVRMLVPLPERLFDPRLLVVEREDPLFAETVARFVATRQDWRQRRDFVRARRDQVQALIAGPSPAAGRFDPLARFEREPVEAAADLGFTQALLSPEVPTEPPEIHVDIAARPASQSTTLFLRLRVDEDAIPSRIEVRWQSGLEEFRYEWFDKPTLAAELLNEDGQPVATPLWFRFTVTGAQLRIGDRDLTGFTLHLDNGRIGIATVGQLTARGAEEDVWWSAGDDETAPEFTGGDWTTVPVAGRPSPMNPLLAPFEQLYLAEFPDGRTELDYAQDVEAALNPTAATSRSPEMHVVGVGLQRALNELEAEASQADDAVDAFFTRAQTNLYRIRKLVLGETAAQRLLINPALAVIAEQETATASAQQFGTFISTAKSNNRVAFAEVNAVLAPRPTITSLTPSSGQRGETLNVVLIGAKLLGASAVRVSGEGVTTSVGKGTSTTLPVKFAIGPNAEAGARTVTVVTEDGTSTPFSSFTITAPTVIRARTDRFDFARKTGLDFLRIESRFSPITSKLDALKDVFGQRPETGPTLPPRGLSIGQRFAEPPATQNLSYARSALTDLLNQLPRLRLPMVGETVTGISGEAVSLLELQGRARPANAETTPEALRKAAITRLLTATPLTQDTDEAEIILAALDFTEVKSAILRTIERVIQERRTLIKNSLEAVTLLEIQRDAANGRLLTVEGRLAEARHDVNVSRSLQNEEQERIAAINERRDTVIRDEVKFLAYVRPRSVNTERRRTQYWKLETFGVPAPVPACLQRHDEPSADLSAYIRLFQHSPARWFPSLAKLIAKLDTPNKLIALLDSARISALAFASHDSASAIRASAQAVQLTVLGAHQAIATLRKESAVIQIPDKAGQRWTDFQRDAERHASVGDLISGKHGSSDVSAAAAAELEQIGKVATCLHAEFAAVTPAIRLLWIERFSQFDRPALLRDFSELPQYGKLDRNTRRRLQEFADWLFGKVNASERDAVSMINDLVRLCLLLASHAPVNQIIAGHVPRPVPVRPGIRIPIRPIQPDLVRVGMEFHVFHDSRVVAKGLVEDLHAGEVTARVEHVSVETTTIDTTMKVQFVPAGLSFKR